MRTQLAAVLLSTFISSGATFARGDEPVVVWDAYATTLLNGVEGGRCAASAGGTTVVGTEWIDSVVTTYSRIASVRCIERLTGVERWLHRVPSSDRTEAVAVSAATSRVFAITRRAPMGTSDGSETFLAFDAVTGMVLFEITSPLPVGDPLSTSNVDALLVSNDGTRILRLDFVGGGSSGSALVRSFDAASGALTWITSFAGTDPLEYFETTGNESVTLSPDGSTLYAAVDVLDSATAQWDCAVVSLAANDGAVKWTQSFALATENERISRPVVAKNSKHVFVSLYASALTPASNRLLKLSATNGSTAFSVPLETYPFAVSLSANGEQIVVAGAAAFNIGPLGPGSPTQPTFHAIDARTGTTQWVEAFDSGWGFSAVMSVTHAPSGGVLHAVVRDPGSSNDYPVSIYTLDDTNGDEVWSTNVSTLGSSQIPFTWLDVVATAPTSARVSCGVTRRVGTSIPIGSELRRAYDSTTSILEWEFVIPSTYSFHSDAAQRLWVDHDQGTLLQWNRSPFAPLPRPFLLQRRSTSTGALLTEVAIPDLGNPTSPSDPPASFEPTVSADGAYVAVQRTNTSGSRVVSIFATATGALVFQRALPQKTNVFTAWDPNANRLHYADLSAKLSGVVDADSGMLLWELPIAGGLAPLLRLGVHPISGDQIVSTSGAATGPWFYDQRVSMRDGSTGATLWTFSTSIDGAKSDRRDHKTRASFDPADPNDIRTGLAFSADGSRVFITDTFLTGAATIARLARLDATTGAFIGFATTSLAPGHDGRTLDVVTSADGRFVHVLADGRGQVATDPVRTLVATFDAVTGVRLWQTWLAGETHARRVLSIGGGGRVAVLASLDTATALATGGVLALLDAESGAELWRHTHTSERADLCDFAALADGAFLLAGSATVAASDMDAVVVRVQGPKLCQGPDEIGLASGGSVAFHVDFATALAGDFHVFVGSASGTSPGIPLSGGFTLPLEFDAYTELTLAAANSALFVNSIGVLDASGDTRVAMDVPAGTSSSLAGVTVHHAVLAIDSTTFDVRDVTNAVGLLLVP